MDDDEIKTWYNIVAKSNTSADIDIFGEIGYWGVTAKQFYKDVKNLGKINRINLTLNSEGGSIIEGNAIYNILKDHPAYVSTDIVGIALSMGSVVAMSSDEIKIAENGLFMIHNPWGFAMGDAKQLRKHAEVMDKMKKGLITAYRNKVDISEVELSELMDSETWYTAQEALDAGFVDSITGKVEAEASFDLSRYRNTPVDCPYNSKRGKVVNINFGDNDEVREHAIETLVASLNEDNPNFKFIIESNFQGTAQTVADRQPKGNKTMDDDVIESATDKNVADLDKVRAEAKAKALAEEKKRQDDIRRVFSMHGDNHSDLLTKCVSDQNIDLSTAQTLLLDEIGKASSPVSGDPNIESGFDASEKYKAATEKAFDQKFIGGQPDYNNEYLSFTLLDHAKYCLKNAGVSLRGMSKMQIVGAAFTHSGSDFPLILENQIGKVLRDAYSIFPETWDRIATTGSVSDFKLNSRYNIGSFDSLDTVPENQEFTHGTFGEEREQIQAATKGKLINLSRQMIINDDLGAFLRVAQLMGRAAQRTIGNDVYNVLFNNAAMSDGVALFDTATHANLAAAGGAISVATLGAGKSAMRLQKDINNRDTLNTMPAVLLAPVGKEDLALQIIASETDPTGTNSRIPNPVRNMVEVITDPRLDANDLTAWYLLADPAFAPTVEVAFLDGNKTPYLETQMGFTIDGVTWKVRLDYGTAAVDWRTAYKNPGA